MLFNSYLSRYADASGKLEQSRKTNLRGFLHLINLIVFTIINIYSYIYVINIYNWVYIGLYLEFLFSTLYHYIDANNNHTLSLIFQVGDYLAIGVDIVSLYFYHLYQILIITLLMEIIIHSYEKIICRYNLGIIKQLPHMIQFIGIFSCSVIYYDVDALICIFFYLISFIFYFKQSIYNKWISDHEFFHLFSCIGGYVKLFISYQR